VGTASCVNQLSLTACVVEIGALRYTPSGVPALNCQLEHVSEVTEAGQVRQVKAFVRAVSFGAVAERLVNQSVGVCGTFKGFLATPRNTKRLVFHIQEFAAN
jgi:primosomal replication protein N